MYVAITEPTTKPTLETVAHRYTIQVLRSSSKMSSMLPATTIVGIAERKPVIKRKMKTAASECTKPIRAQQMA